MKTVGDLVVYGTNGVCRIADLREETFSGTPRQYYILRPIHEIGNNSIFVPVDNQTLVNEMRAILTPDELYDIVQNTPPFAEEEWPQDGRSRSKFCRELVNSGNREQFIRLIKTVKGSSRTPSASEELCCQKAAAMLYQEFSLVLKIEKAEVIPFLLGELDLLPLA